MTSCPVRRRAGVGAGTAPPPGAPPDVTSEARTPTRSTRGMSILRETDAWILLVCVRVWKLGMRARGNWW